MIEITHAIIRCKACAMLRDGEPAANADATLPGRRGRGRLPRRRPNSEEAHPPAFNTATRGTSDLGSAHGLCWTANAMLRAFLDEARMAQHARLTVGTGVRRLSWRTGGMLGSNVEQPRGPSTNSGRLCLEHVQEQDAYPVVRGPCRRFVISTASAEFQLQARSHPSRASTGSRTDRILRGNTILSIKLQYSMRLNKSGHTHALGTGGRART